MTLFHVIIRPPLFFYLPLLLLLLLEECRKHAAACRKCDDDQIINQFYHESRNKKLFSAFRAESVNPTRLVAVRSKVALLFSELHFVHMLTWFISWKLFCNRKWFRRCCIISGWDSPQLPTRTRTRIFIRRIRPPMLEAVLVSAVIVPRFGFTWICLLWFNKIRAKSNNKRRKW